MIRSAPISCAFRSAASEKDSFSPGDRESGSIQTLPSPRHQATLPALITTMLSTVRSVTLILSLSGNSRSKETESTQGFFWRFLVTCSSSRLNSVVPDWTLASLAMLSELMCSVASASMLDMVNSGV